MRETQIKKQKINRYIEHAKKIKRGVHRMRKDTEPGLRNELGWARTKTVTLLETLLKVKKRLDGDA